MRSLTLHAAPSEDDLATVGLEVVHVRDLAARAARTAPWPTWLGPGSPGRAAAERVGIEQLWEHQVTAANALAGRRHVVLTTGTASGKSLAYLLPIIAASVGDGLSSPASGPEVGTETQTQTVRWRRRSATSLYLAPTKALAHDQARACVDLTVPGWRVAVVDGDTDRADRLWARDHAHHLLTNPDLLHTSLLPQHQRWASYLRSMRYVVVDEAHRYRGVFGAQVAAVLRRLRRIAAHYDAQPAFAVLSATATEAVRTASDLTGLSVSDLELVEDDGSPRGRVRITLTRARRPLESAAAELMAEGVRAGRQVLTFVPSRRLAEEVARTAAARAGIGEESVVAYRAGYLAADRRKIEQGLAAGAVRGVAATNALELGVDVAGLDTVVLCGYPGSRAAFWQQVGRAGRRGGPAEVVLIARPHPLDAYLLDHPAALFDQPVESPVLDPTAGSVLGPHLAAAAQELPLRPGDERWFGAGAWPLVARLTERGVLRRRPDGWYWTSPQRAVDRINLRNTDPRSVEIIEQPTGRVLGTVGPASADQVVHPGAVYLHQGETYLCQGVDWATGEALVWPARPGYLTQPLVDTEVRAEAAELQRTVGTVRLAHAPVLVCSTVTAFRRRDELSGRIWDTTPLECPQRVLDTVATSLTIELDQALGIEAGSTSRPRRDAGVHAVEHLLAGVLPVVVPGDRGDVGNHSWVEDEIATIAVYDRQPGSGLAVRAYECAETWLAAALDRIEHCSCATGCPACILAAGCGSTRPLDKATAHRLLAGALFGAARGTPAGGRDTAYGHSVFGGTGETRSR